MKAAELLNKLEKIAPLALSNEFCAKHNSYDNSGIIVDGDEEIRGVLFSLDLSENSLAEALRLGYNAIVTHHPAIFGGIKSLSFTDARTKLIAECVHRKITVISMHLNFDSAPEGIDYYLMKGLGGDNATTHITLSGGGYGRAYTVPETTMKNFVERIKGEFGTERIIYYGDNQKIIRRAASFCGAGCDDYSIAFAEAEGADVFVSSDMRHHQITALLSKGISVVVLTHYASENYGFNKIYGKLIEELEVPAAYYCDSELL